MKLAQVRKFALSLPDATEAPHFEMTSFLVRGKIFATAPPDGRHVHVFVGEEEARASVAEEPAVFEELWWGKRLTGVRAELGLARPQSVFPLLTEAWRRKAPRRLVAAFDSSSPC
jgi:hypothetical protein